MKNTANNQKLQVSKMPLIGLAVIAAITLTLALTACDIPKDDDDSDGTTFTSVGAFQEWLDKQPNNTPETPYRVKLNVKDIIGLNLTPLWSPSRANKYVYLDFSGSTITYIGNSAFHTDGNLVGITIGDSVTSIGKDAFSYSGLTSVTIPNSVTTIGESAFEQCGKLTSVIIGNSVTTIGERAFSYCIKLTSIIIPNSVTNIGEDAFVRCRNLTSVIIGNSVTAIGSSAFYGCEGLTSVVIPNSVTSLNGFAYCTNLTSINIPSSVTVIGNDAFRACSNLANVTIPSSVTSIGNGAFNRSGSGDGTNIGLTSVTFEGTIPSSGFAKENVFIASSPFPGDLRSKFYATDSTNGTPGTYTRPSISSNTWTKQ